MASGWALIGRRVLRAAKRSAPKVVELALRPGTASAPPRGEPADEAPPVQVDRTSPGGTSGRGRHTDRRRPAGGSRGDSPPAGRARPPRHRPAREVAREVSYAPELDGDADPGEVVWTWVAYEEDPTRGKDRPVLVVGRDGRDVLALMLSSRNHDGDDGWLALGPGAWDREQRASWLRLDRVLVVEDGDVRREGSVLARDRFDAVARRLRSDHGWG